MQLDAHLHPLRLATRFAVVSVAILWLAHHFERAFVEPMIPAFRTVTTIIGTDFDILEMVIASQESNETLRVRADFSHPVFVTGRFIYPFKGQGWMQADLTLGGILQYALFTLIIVVAWPASRRELALRLVTLAPLLAIFLAIQVSTTILAQFWFPVQKEIDPNSHWPLLVWSRFLMGGGGLAFALLLAVFIIALTKKWPRAVGQTYGNRFIASS